MKNYSSSTSSCRIDDAWVSIRRLFLIITDTARRVVSYVTFVDNYVNEVKVFERCTLPRLWAVSATNLQLRAWFCIGQTTQHSRYVQDAEDFPKNTIYWVFTGAPTTSGPTDNNLRQPPRAMSKGTRFLTLAIPLLLLYILALYHIIPTPLLPTKLADDILPVVSPILLGCWF